MKCYVASSFKCKDDFHALRKVLEANGHTITHDWTKEDASAVDPEELDTYLMLCAGNDLMGVAAADVFILIARPNMAGAFVEMGVALAMSVPVVVLDAYRDGNQNNIFYALPQCQAFQHVKSYDDIIAILAAPFTNPYDKIGVISDDN